MFSEIEFLSAKTVCKGRLYEPSLKKANGAGIVLAHGLCGTMDSGLFAYAEAFAKAGFHALVFDYRGFGLSSGEPRQYISVPMQIADWKAAINFLRTHDNVDADRLGLWGMSFSGGHVIHLAHDDQNIRAIVSLVPTIDPALSQNVGVFHREPKNTAALTGAIIEHAKKRLFSKQFTMLQVAPTSGNSVAVLGGKEADIYPKLAGPSWRNELHPDSLITGKFEQNNAALLTDDFTCPVLLQMGQNDKVVSNEAIKTFARRCGPLAKLTVYDGHHFTMLQKNAKRSAAIDEAVQFYRGHLIR